MNTIFTCTQDNCPNKDIEFLFFGEVKTAECGGCHKKLKGTAVQAVELVSEPASE